MPVARAKRGSVAVRALTFLAAWSLVVLSAGELRADVAVTLYAGAASAQDGDLDLTDGSTLKLRTWTHQLLFGVTFSF